MKSHPILDLPEISCNYVDEFGEIDKAVYLAASSIWPYAHAYALRLTNDEEQARDLMLRAIALVSKRNRSQTIGNMKGYLILVFKRCVWEEARRAKRFECFSINDLETLYDEANSELDRMILVKEIVAKMDIETASIFEKLILGYSFAEIALECQTSPTALRTKFRRRLGRLASHIKNEMQNGAKHQSDNCVPYVLP